MARKNKSDVELFERLSHGKASPGLPLPSFRTRQEGAAWVLLPAALVVAGLYVMGTYKSPAQAKADGVAKEMAEKTQRA